MLWKERKENTIAFMCIPTAILSILYHKSREQKFVRIEQFFAHISTFLMFEYFWRTRFQKLWPRSYLVCIIMWLYYKGLYDRKAYEHIHYIFHLLFPLFPMIG
jgi:hypothetical protein